MKINSKKWLGKDWIRMGIRKAFNCDMLFSSPSSEILINSIRNTIYPIDFAMYSTCPRPMEREEPEVPLNYPIHYDSLAVRWVDAKSSVQCVFNVSKLLLQMDWPDLILILTVTCEKKFKLTSFIIIPGSNRALESNA